ncbi:Protein CBG19412 [Caenorhabditis briggsae]|uniref:Protein CBG19412 n=1 Tax=Caenorhabditis briggsae TaxID=6238 RepID=A8XVJ9_CAEBR|nr:Protein CBG19412 [Caenorhabditis briggsae]CAP36667.1 Protein CBG19412 [Caenorhabditis briggsae]
MILILLFLFFAPASTLYQSYGVHGQFSCGESPAKGITVKLYDLDRYSHENDLLDEGVTNGFGNITLSGGTAELTRIEPMLEVIHDCNDGGKAQVYWPSQYKRSHQPAAAASEGEMFAFPGLRGLRGKRDPDYNKRVPMMSLKGLRGKRARFFAGEDEQ